MFTEKETNKWSDTDENITSLAHWRR